MTLRQTDDTKLANKLQPDFTKSTLEQNKQHVEGAVDTAASYLPGQHKTSDHLSDHKRNAPLTHDTGRKGPIDSLVDAVKPKSSETLEDKTHRHVDNGLSVAQPEHEKGVAQKIMDTVNPQKYGTATEHSGDCTCHYATTGKQPGVLASVTDAVKNTVNGITGQDATGHRHNTAP